MLASKTRHTWKCVLVVTGLIHSGQLAADSFWSQFIDQQDGKLDLSNFVLDNATGFMPLPIIITEPAVGGFGLGAALAFFHENKEEKQRRQSGEIEAPDIPPSVSGLAAAYTVNDSWLAGAFHQGSYRKDSIRYLGAIGSADINLKFYGRSDEENPIDDDGEKFKIEGNFLIQDVRFRIARSKFFLGGEYTWLNSTTKFDNTGIEDLIDEKLEASTAGAGVIAFYDSRDNYFTPVNGFDGKLTYTWYRPGLGSDFNFDKLKANTHAYWMLRENLQFALRADAKSITRGDAPFWEVPFIDLRGIPMLRYQGEVTALAEVEARWDISPRWGVNAFIGAGRAADEVSDLGDATSRVSRGIGFRYLIMRLLKARAGIDIAWGPEQAAFYLTFGSAWSRD